MVVQMETGSAQYQNWEGVSQPGLGSFYSFCCKYYIFLFILFLFECLKPKKSFCCFFPEVNYILLLDDDNSN